MSTICEKSWTSALKSEHIFGDIFKGLLCTALNQGCAGCGITANSGWRAGSV
jgi:hypothetical protein